MKNRIKRYLLASGLFLLILISVFYSHTFSLSARSIEEDKSMGDNYYATMPKEDHSLPETRTPQLFAVPTNPAAPAGTIATGVDISHHNGSINFTKLKNAVDFVILRCGYGQDKTEFDDRCFEANVKGCMEYEIPFGIYLYSYADSPEYALSEVQHTIRLLKKCAEFGGIPSLPIFYDMEDSSQAKLDNSEKVAIAQTYCGTLRSYGFPVGIYANTYWWENYLTDPYYNSIPYHWVARYNATLGYSGKCDIWQCSESAILPGMGTQKWDLNYMLRDTYVKISLQEIFTKYIMNQPLMQPVYPLSLCQIKSIGNQAYNGSAIKPEITVSYGTTTYKKTSDYTVTFSQNVKPGLATVTIKGTGSKLTGTLKKTFIIVPKKMQKPSIKRISKGGTLSWKKSVGASGYQITYQKKGSKTWKNLNTSKLTKKITKLKKNTYYRVKIRAYKTINKKKYYGAYSSIKSWKTR